MNLSLAFVMALGLTVSLVEAAAPTVAAERTLRSWEFDRDGDTEGWRANGDITEYRVAGGALRCRAIGSDPILEYTADLQIDAAPNQGVEIQLSADRDGPCELFWSGTDQGRYGGFDGEKRTPFTVRGNSKPKRYRLFPFWHRERRIIRLRLDLFGGARFTFHSIRVFEAGEWSKVPAAPDFDFSHGVEGWFPLRDADVRDGEGGMVLRATAPGGIVLGPRIDAAAEEAPVASLDIVASPTDSRVSLVYATTGSHGLQEIEIPRRRDGRGGAVNVDLLDAPGWQGRIVAVGLRLEKQGEARVKRIALSAAPRGPAALEILSFGVEETLPRAGREVIVSARTVNRGGEPAVAPRAEIRLPDGARLIERRPPRDAPLRYGQEARWQWVVRFDRPGDARPSVTFHSGGNPPVSAAAVERITAPPKGIEPGGEIPAPVPVRGKIDVGVYYFPGWRGASQWAPIMRFPERRPAAGWYREGTPELADWHVKWALEHGITFFAYDWYWSQGSRQLEHALHDGLFQSRHGKAMKYCLLWANHNPPGTSSLEDCRAVARAWLDDYFRRAEYLRIDGKPVMIIFSPYRLREDLGSGGAREALDAMRGVARDGGLPGITFIACVGGSPEEARVARQEGYDAVTAYNWSAIGVRNDEKRSPYSRQIDGYRRQWDALAAGDLPPLLVPASGGWDSRPWHGEAALAITDRAPSLFRRHLLDARRFIEKNPETALPMVLIEAWNEWGEGSYIEPHREFGFGYLDAVREVFTAAPRAHLDLTPSDLGRPVPQVAAIDPFRTAWSFASETGGWDAGMQVTDPVIRDGALEVTSTGNDPALFGPPIEAPASEFSEAFIRIRMGKNGSVPVSETGQLFWSTRTSPASEANSVRFPLTVDGVWRDIRIRVDGSTRWRDIITGLRLDLGSTAGITARIAEIRLVP